MTPDGNRDATMFGSDAAEWLRRWDADQTVWSIEMGGLGPGYEQCIQITVAEILRHMIYERYDRTGWKDDSKWKADRIEIEQMGHSNPVIGQLGLSGAQWGAALNLACQLYMKGPAGVMLD